MSRQGIVVMIGTWHIDPSVIRALESRVAGIVVVGRNPMTIAISANPCALDLPHIEPPAPRDQRPYWRRFEKRRTGFK
jgi:hypothetical protein